MSLATELRERADFVELVRRVTASAGPLADFFDRSRAVAFARAPGRLDVLGGIADYSGSLVLELPIAEAAFVAAQLTPEPLVRCVSVTPSGAVVRSAAFPSAPFAAGYAASARAVQRVPADAWAGYVAGPLAALTEDKALTLQGGVRILLCSRVPEGKGVSSSAALAVASFYALAAASHVPFYAEEAALLCQKVENRVVGAPCGVMDPMTSCLGKKGRLLELLCQPAEVLGHSELPDDLAVFGVDSGVRHAVTGADYKTVRTAAFMGYRILAHALGVRASEGDGAGSVHLENPPFGGYLANARPSDIHPALLTLLPERLRGEEFLATYGGTTDSLTVVEATRAYPVRAATLHPIHEHQRVRAFAELLRAPASVRRRHVLGELFYQAHASYTACGLGSEATDQLVGLVREAGTNAGVFGAKITGGGSGGTVAILAEPSARETVEAIAERYRARTGAGGGLFVGSSAGAAQLGAALVALQG